MCFSVRLSNFIFGGEIFVKVFQDTLAGTLTAEISMLSIDFIVLAASLQLRNVLPSPWVYACQGLLWDTTTTDLGKFFFVPSTRYA